MKKYLLIFAMILLLTVTASAATVYVSDGGTGDGTSASTPLGSLTDAYQALGNDGGEIVLVGTVSMPLHKGTTTRTAFVEPAHDGKVTVRGADDSATLLFASVYEYHMSGDTEFRDMIISSGARTSGLNFCARGHHLTMGEGLTMHSTGVVSGTTQVGTKVYLHGGCIPGATVAGYTNCNNHLTVKSGTYWAIVGFNRNIDIVTAGTLKLEIGGDVHTHYLITGSSGEASFVYPTHVEVTVIGDLSVSQQFSLGNQHRDVEHFAVDLTIEDGYVDFTGTYSDYNKRTRVSELDIYVNPESADAIRTYSELFAGYGDRESALDPCAHVFTESTVGSVTTATCSSCGMTAKSTAKTDVTEGVYTHESENVRVQILSDGIVRVEETYGDGFVDVATLVVPDRSVFTGTAVVADEDADTVILSTKDFTVNVPKTGATVANVRIFGKDNAVLYDFPNTKKGAFYSSLPAPADTPDAYAILDNGILPPEGGLTYNESTDDTSGWGRAENTDVYVLLPFGNAEALRRQFITVTGPTMLSNVKTLGAWYSKWTNYTAEQKLALIEEFRTRMIPLDMMVIDTEWKNTSENGNDGDGTGYEVNTTLYPDMEGFLAKAEAAGILILFNDHTHKTSLTITTPEELKWQSAGILSLMKMGLDGWWYDRNWSYSIKSPYSDVTYTTIGHVLYYDTMAKYHAENANSRVLMLSNVDWLMHGHQQNSPSLIGHRYGIQWTGDIYWDPLHLKREVSNMVKAGVIGASPYLTADLGGFWHNDTVSENNFLRWMQYGAFSPVYRPHSTLSSKNEHLPWSYGEDSCAIVKDFLDMRYHLMPTYYALARENHDTGMPLARRLDYYYPEYTESQDNTQYLIGRDILVAPFWGTMGDGRDAVPLSWLTAADGSEGLDLKVYNVNSSMSRDVYFTQGSLVWSGVEKNELAYYWYNGSPHGANTDYFALRYTGKITPEYDCYIGVLADDCARIFIDGKPLVGWKSGQLAVNFNTNLVLKAGETHDITVDYYELSGKAVFYLMCEPVLPENTSERTVFVPDGTWQNVFTGEKIMGPKTVTVTGDTSVMPIYVREGAAILTSDVISPMTGANWKEIAVNLYGLSETAVTLYEDDGATTNYLNGEYRMTPVTVTPSGDAWQVTVGTADGAFATDYDTRKVTLRVHSDTPVTAAIDGKALDVTVIAQDADALPFANKGASRTATVYEVTVDAPLTGETSVTLVQSPMGDVNGDGTLTVKDTLLALKALLNRQECPAADMDGDGSLSLLDALTLLKKTIA